MKPTVLRSQVLVVLLMAACKVVMAQDLQQARQLLQDGQHVQAVEALSRWLDSSPRDPDALLFRGLAYSRLQRWTEAVADLELAASVSPAYADVWQALGNAYRWSDRAAAAADAYGRLAALRPDDPQVHLLRARSLQGAGDHAGARLSALRARDLGVSDSQLGDLVLVESTAGIVDRGIAVVPSEMAQPGYGWAVSMSGSQLDTPRSSGSDRSWIVRRYGSAGSVALERLQVSRFGLRGDAYAIDAYPRLWTGAYANLRYQRSSDAVLYPVRAWRAELYQNVGGGWEMAASHDFLGFDSQVQMNAVALAKYWGNFYIRLRHQRTETNVSSGRGDRLVIRYYYEGDADHYLEGSWSSGRSDDLSNLLAGQSRSGTKGASFYHFLNSRWGVKGSYSDSRDSASGRERSVSMGVVFRW